MEDGSTNKPPLSPKNWGSRMIRRKTGDEKYSKDVKPKVQTQKSLTQSCSGEIFDSNSSPSTSKVYTNVAAPLARKTPNVKKSWFNQKSFDDQKCHFVPQNLDNFSSGKDLSNTEEGSDDSNSPVKSSQNKYRGSQSCAAYNAPHSIKAKIIRGLSFNKQITPKNRSNYASDMENPVPPKSCEIGKSSPLLSKDDSEPKKGPASSSTSHAKILEMFVKPFIRHVDGDDSSSETTCKQTLGVDGKKSISAPKEGKENEVLAEKPTLNTQNEKPSSNNYDLKLPTNHLPNEEDEDNDSIYHTPRESQGDILDSIRSDKSLPKVTSQPNVFKRPSNRENLWKQIATQNRAKNYNTLKINKSDPCLNLKLKGPCQLTTLRPRASSVTNLTRRLSYIEIHSFYNKLTYSISSDSESNLTLSPINTQAKFMLATRCNSLSASNNKPPSCDKGGHKFYKNTYHNSLEMFRRDSRRQSQSSSYKGRNNKGLKPVTLGKKDSNGREHYRKELVAMMYGGKIRSKYQQKRRYSRSEINIPPSSALLNKYRTMHSTSFPVAVKQKPIQTNTTIIASVSELPGKKTGQSSTLSILNINLSKNKKKKHHIKLSEYEDNFYTSHLAKLPKPDLFLMGFKDTRHHIIQEIYDTEYSYIESLIMLIEMYYKPMISNNFLLMPEKYLVSQIFETIADLLNFHAIFLHKLHSRLIAFQEDTKIGDLFQNMFGSQKIVDSYLFFVNNWKLLRKTLMDLKEQNSKFNKFIEKQTNYHRGRLNLDALIIMPIQRLPRYELLLKELLKYSDIEHCDTVGLEKAKELIQGLAKKIDSLDKYHIVFNP